MNTKKLLKAANSKSQLVRAVLMYQKALLHYANESNWLVKDDLIIWNGDDDPTKVAEIVLGLRKQSVRLPDRNKEIKEVSDG